MPTPETSRSSTSSAWQSSSTWGLARNPETWEPRTTSKTRSVVWALHGAADAAQHAAEHQLVDGAEQVPVRQPDVARRIEHRRLTDFDGAGAVGFDLELQPQTTRDLHLGGEAKAPPGIDGFNPPEVDGIGDAQIVGISPAPPETHAAPQRVDQSADAPEPVCRIPSRVPADTLDRLERLPGGGGDPEHARGDQASAERDRRQARRRLGRERIRPPGFGESHVLVDQRPFDRAVNSAGADGECLQARPGLHDRFVAQTLHQGSGHLTIDRRDQAQEEPGYPWGEQRRVNHPSTQPALARIFPDDLSVRDRLRTADLEDGVAAVVPGQSGHKVVQKVFNGDRPGGCLDPRRSDNHRQALDECPDDLIRGAA